jgi:hypothetical protein
LWKRSRSYSRLPLRKRVRTMCSKPDGRGSTPSGGSGWLVRWATKNTLSRVTVALSISGRTPAMLSRAFDSSRVSSWNRPSLSPSMSP